MSKQVMVGMAVVVALYALLFVYFPKVAIAFLIIDAFGWMLWDTTSHLRTDIPKE